MIRPGFTRRGLLGLFPAAFAHRRTASGSEPEPLPIDRLLAEYGGGATAVAYQRYRVHATVNVLSIPVWSRRDVSGACITVEERGADGPAAVVLQFAAGSWPEQAGGLNRLGVMQEVVVSRGRQWREAAYLGFITGSNERNYEESRRAIDKGAGRTAGYVASQGTAGSNSEGSTCRIDLPSSYNWTDWREVALRVRSALATGVPLPAYDPPEGAATFLYTVRAAMLDPRPRLESVFVHNGKTHSFRTEKSPIHNRPGRLRLRGAIRSEAGQTSSFQLWFDKGSTLPSRIEYSPRSFLHLALSTTSGSMSRPLRCF